MITRHNILRDLIAEEYCKLPALSCRFCHHSATVPRDGVVRVATEYKSGRFRADVAALDANGRIAAVIEVVDTNSPKPDVLDAQAELPAAFYVTMDALNWLDQREFHGWCSAFCWKNRESKNVEDWSARRCRGPCELPLHLLEYPQTLIDWENPYAPICLLCAARQPSGQWRPAGDLVFSDAQDRVPQNTGNVVDLFLAFSDADFWAQVWSKRTHKVSQARMSETETARCLDQVEAAFDVGEWNRGYLMLQPIGAPAWDRPADKTMFAFEHSNCMRTAFAWRRLREYRISRLPTVVQAAIRTRPPLPGVGLRE